MKRKVASSPWSCRKVGNVCLYSLRTWGYSVTLLCGVTFLIAICGLMSGRLGSTVGRKSRYLQQEEIARAETSRHSEAPASGVMTDGLWLGVFVLLFLAGPAKP